MRLLYENCRVRDYVFGSRNDQMTIILDFENNAFEYVENSNGNRKRFLRFRKYAVLPSFHIASILLDFAII